MVFRGHFVPEEMGEGAVCLWWIPECRVWLRLAWPRTVDRSADAKILRWHRDAHTVIVLAYFVALTEFLFELYIYACITVISLCFTRDQSLTS